MSEGAATIMPKGAPDDEIATIMAELSRLQTWCILMASKDSGGVRAADLVQRTRCLIVERLYPSNTKDH